MKIFAFGRYWSVPADSPVNSLVVTVSHDTTCWADIVSPRRFCSDMWWKGPGGRLPNTKCARLMKLPDCKELLSWEINLIWRPLTLVELKSLATHAKDNLGLDLFGCAFHCMTSQIIARQVEWWNVLLCYSQKMRSICSSTGCKRGFLTQHMF